MVTLSFIITGPKLYISLRVAIQDLSPTVKSHGAYIRAVGAIKG